MRSMMDLPWKVPIVTEYIDRYVGVPVASLGFMAKGVVRTETEPAINGRYFPISAGDELNHQFVQVCQIRLLRQAILLQALWWRGRNQHRGLGGWAA